MWFLGKVGTYIVITRTIYSSEGGSASRIHRRAVGLRLLHTRLLTILGHPRHRHGITLSLFRTITFPRSSLSLSLSQSHNSFSFFPCLILVKILSRSLVFLTDLPVSSHVRGIRIITATLRHGSFSSSRICVNIEQGQHDCLSKWSGLALSLLKRDVGQVEADLANIGVQVDNAVNSFSSSSSLADALVSRH